MRSTRARPAVRGGAGGRSASDGRSELIAPGFSSAGGVHASPVGSALVAHRGRGAGGGMTLSSISVGGIVPAPIRPPAKTSPINPGAKPAVRLPGFSEKTSASRTGGIASPSKPVEIGGLPGDLALGVVCGRGGMTVRGIGRNGGGVTCSGAAEQRASARAVASGAGGAASATDSISTTSASPGYSFGDVSRLRCCGCNGRGGGCMRLAADGSARDQTQGHSAKEMVLVCTPIEGLKSRWKRRVRPVQWAQWRGGCRGRGFGDGMQAGESAGESSPRPPAQLPPPARSVPDRSGCPTAYRRGCPARRAPASSAGFFNRRSGGRRMRFGRWPLQFLQRPAEANPPAAARPIRSVRVRAPLRRARNDQARYRAAAIPPQAARRTAMRRMNRRARREIFTSSLGWPGDFDRLEIE